MRDRMERFVVLPFSVGCISDSSVAVATLHENRRHKADPNSSAPCDEESFPGENMKNVVRWLALSKPETPTTGLNRLFKSLKTFSQLFAYKEEMDEDDMDMEIGLPTDVKHVSHIGWEGPETTAPENAWEALSVSPELLPLRPMPLKQHDSA